MTRYNQYRAVPSFAQPCFSSQVVISKTIPKLITKLRSTITTRLIPHCIWQDAKKFPVQAATSDDAKTEGFDVSTDAGLLTRTTAEKKVFIIASKQVNNYDLSDQGRSAWTPDTTQPGYGNFCFGHRAVDADR